MAAIPRLHHFVTKAYLDGFLEPSKKHLHVYRRKETSPFKTTPEKIARIRDYHTSIAKDGSLDISLEELIEREIESPGIPVIHQLSRGKTNITSTDRYRLAHLIALQSVRVPYERDFIDTLHRESLSRWRRLMDEASSATGKPVNEITEWIGTSSVRPTGLPTVVTREDVKFLLEENEADPAGFSRDVFPAIAKSMAKVIVGMKWIVYYTSGNGRYITSDCPVVKVFRDDANLGVGIRRLDCNIIFPLSSTALLQIRHDGWFSRTDLRNRVSRHKSITSKRPKTKIERAEANDAEVQKFNELSADHAHQWAFSGTTQEWLSMRMQTRFRNSKTREIVSESSKITKSGNLTFADRKTEFAVRDGYLAT